MTFTIRDAKLEDLPRVVEIYNASMPGKMAVADTCPVTVESKVKWFEEHDSKHRPLWVYEKDGKIIAWISLQAFRDRPAYHSTAEFSIYVDPLHHKEGVGTYLLQKMIDECPKLGIAVLLGLIFKHNIPSLQLARKMGFKKWGHLYQVTELDGIRRDVIIVGLKIKANMG